MSTRFLDGADFPAAIRTIEGVSSAEVVVALRRRSHGYRHANVIVGAIVAFAALSVMLFASEPFTLGAILLDPFLVGLGAGWLVELTPGIKRALTPAARRRRHVERAARATFIERNIHATTGRTGVLVYLSWLEQQVVVVPDIAVVDKVPADAIAALERELTERMREGKLVAERLAAFAPALAKALPRRDDDVNELPDSLDHDMESR